ncbi:hypothetical protein D3C76_1417680 [compost metagenome]
MPWNLELKLRDSIRRNHLRDRLKGGLRRSAPFENKRHGLCLQLISYGDNRISQQAAIGFRNINLLLQLVNVCNGFRPYKRGQLI